MVYSLNGFAALVRLKRPVCPFGTASVVHAVMVDVENSSQHAPPPWKYSLGSSRVRSVFASFGGRLCDG